MLEPGCPSFKRRLQAYQKLTRRGYQVRLLWTNFSNKSLKSEVKDQINRKEFNFSNKTINIKLSIASLNALEKALEVKKRRLIKSMPEEGIEIPAMQKDISLSIKEVFKSIMDFFVTGGKKLTFRKLVENEHSKEERIGKFQPLLHLDYQRKIELHQEKPFADIDIELLYKNKNKPIVEEDTVSQE